MSRRFDRKMLAQFLPNPESIRAFEELVRSNDIDLPDKIKAALDAALDALGKFESLTGFEGAAKIGFEPVGTVSATNVQQAIAELSAEQVTATQVQSGSFNVAVSGGTGNALTASFSPPITERVSGALLLVRSSSANSVTAPTLTVNGMGAIDIVKAGGEALKAGEIAANNWLLLSYDSTLLKYILHNPTPQLNTELIATSINGGPLSGRRNRVMNGNFAINQRNVSGTVTLTAGQYGHDRWKAGASGCTYTFVKNGPDTTLTITAGSLVHIVDAEDIEGATYRLSQGGSAVARYAVGGAALSGSYSSVPMNITATVGQQVAIEFSLGTVGLVQMEPGTIRTPFERRSLSEELSLCQLYYWRGLPCMALNTPAFATSCIISWPIKFARTMRAIPVLSKNTAGSTYDSLTSETFDQPSRDGARLLYVSTAQATNASALFSATSWFAASCDL